MKEKTSCVILLIGLWWAPLVMAGYSCPQPNGYFPDHENCEIYYRCIEGGWDRHSCGPGTVFNPNHNTCDYPSRVPGCGGHDSSNNPPKTETPDYPTPEYPTPEYPTTTPYPTTRYRTTKYQTTESRTTQYRPTTRYPSTRPPQTRPPPTRPPQTRPPPTRPPPTRKPTTRYIPSSRYPTSTSRYTPPRATQPHRDYGKFYCKSDGYFGHPKYCDHFYRCVMTRPILFACAPGTYFDDIIGTCNYKEQITECDEDGIKQGGPRPTYRPSRRPTQSPSDKSSQQPSSTSSWTSAMPSWSPAFSDYFTTTTSFPSTSTEIFICPNRCGFYPHPTRCDQFVVCLDFEAKLHNCPPELYFNWQAKTCDYKENVQCYISNFENIYKKK